MKHRSVPALVLLTIFTFGIFGLVWFVSTKVEMNEKFDAGIPTSILIIVPFANLYWTWKWAEGVERSTNGHMGAVGAFLLVMLAGVIGMAIVQAKFNTLDYSAAPLPTARVAA